MQEKNSSQEGFKGKGFCSGKGELVLEELVQLQRSCCLLQSCQGQSRGSLPAAARSARRFASRAEHRGSQKILGMLLSSCQGRLSPPQPCRGASQSRDRALSSASRLPVPQGSEASLERSSRRGGSARGLRLSPSLCHPFEEKELKIG